LMFTLSANGGFGKAVFWPSQGALLAPPRPPACYSHGYGLLVVWLTRFAWVRDWQQIRTERLLMRRWRDSDRAPFAALNADPEVMRYFPALLDRAESDRSIDRFEQRFDQHGFGLWALEVLATGDFIGFTGLNPMPDGVPGAGDQEVGWRLARHAWHMGYATEAARAALDVGLLRLGLPVIWSMTAVLNTPSQAVMRRLGMVRHGAFDHPRIEMGHALRPHVVYRTRRPPARP
jgi:RimJ/RimL family protein N-acetyltransferase